MSVRGPTNHLRQGYGGLRSIRFDVLPVFGTDATRTDFDVADDVDLGRHADADGSGKPSPAKI
jgi:hypothetical protein